MNDDLLSIIFHIPFIIFIIIATLFCFFVANLWGFI